MNKKLLIGSCGLAAVAGNVFAADEDVSYFNPYASLKGGYAVLGKRDDIKYKGGFAGAVELGVSYDAWRLGLELGYKSNKIKNYKGDGFEGTHYSLNGGFDSAAAANIAARDVRDAANAYAAIVAIGEKSVFNMNGNNVGRFAIFGVQPSANGLQGLALKNVSYFEVQKLSALTGMVNVFYDYALTDAWSMYAGVGLGVARVSYHVLSGESDPLKAVKIGTERAHDAPNAYTVAEAKEAVLAALPGLNLPLTKSEHSKTVFAWQLMAGVGYEFDENWKLTFGYKLFNTAKVKVLGDEKIKAPFNHTFEAGLTYTF